MIYLELVDRDGGMRDLVQYDTLEELLKEWPYADGKGTEWSAWIGSK